MITEEIARRGATAPGCAIAQMLGTLNNNHPGTCAASQAGVPSGIEHRVYAKAHRYLVDVESKTTAFLDVTPAEYRAFLCREYSFVAPLERSLLHGSGSIWR